MHARIVNGTIAELFPDALTIEGVSYSLAQRYQADFVEALVAVPDTSQVGWVETSTGFAAPAAPAPTQAQCEAGIQAALDAGAQSWGYDSLLSAASYVSSTNKQFAAEANALIGWRDSVWGWAHTQLAAVQAGTQPMPASVAALVAEIPALPTRPTAS